MTTSNLTTSEPTLAESLLEYVGTPESVIVGVLLMGLMAVAWVNYPLARFYLARALGRYDDEILELYEKNLTPLMRQKLDETSEKYVKNEILRQVILSAFDHTAEESQKELKKIIRKLAKDA